MDHGDRDSEERGSAHRERSQVKTLDRMSQHPIPDTRKQDVSGKTERTEQHEECKIEEEKSKREHLHDWRVGSIRKTVKEDRDRPGPYDIRKLSKFVFGPVGSQASRR